MKYLIGYSGLDDYWNYQIIECKDDTEASYIAWEEACNVYERYIGSNGIRDIQDIIYEEDCLEKEALKIFQEDREMWIDYFIESDVNNKIKELIKENSINSEKEIINYENMCN